MGYDVSFGVSMQQRLADGCFALSLQGHSFNGDSVTQETIISKAGRFLYFTLTNLSVAVE